MPMNSKFKFMDYLSYKSQNMKAVIVDDDIRMKVQFLWVYRIFVVIALFMSIVNIITGKTLLMYATLSFSLLNCFNILLGKKGEKLLSISALLFSVEATLLFTFFIVSGSPEGFSVIWICMLPSSGLLLFKRKTGSIWCFIVLLLILFFFQTDFGNSFLQYPYTDSFKLRFPMLYVSFFALSFFLETLRSYTYDAMQEAKKRYEYLYAHDALTGVYNRYGFNTELDKLLSKNEKRNMGLLILDLDHFKNINDKYGHLNGDLVLQEIAKFLKNETNDKAQVCRWGGEEFALLFFDNIEAEKVSEDLLARLRIHPIQIEGAEITIKASFGLVTTDGSETVQISKLVLQTDRCLYKAKNSGRNRLVKEEYNSTVNNLTINGN